MQSGRDFIAPLPLVGGRGLHKVATSSKLHLSAPEAGHDYQIWVFNLGAESKQRVKVHVLC
jgi:hypothetical protein